MKNSLEKKYLLVVVIGLAVITGIAVIIYWGVKEDESQNANLEKVQTFQSEYGIRFQYPISWSHWTADPEDLLNEPFAIATALASENFTSGTIEEARSPFSDTSEYINLDITVYKTAVEESLEDVYAFLGFQNSELVKVGDYDARKVVRDDSNHEVASARVYLERYLVDSGEYLFVVSFSAQDQNSLQMYHDIIEEILDTIQLENSTLSSQDRASQTIDIRNGFSMSLPEGWKVEGILEDVINTVKFGSPAYSINFIPLDSQNEVFPNGITISTFTIDSRLTARGVANLIHDRRIADKLDEGTDECIFPTRGYNIDGLDAYSYKEDNTDLTRCTSEGTEIGIVETVIGKKPASQETIVTSLAVSTEEEYQELLPDFLAVINSVSLTN